MEIRNASFMGSGVDVHEYLPKCWHGRAVTTADDDDDDAGADVTLTTGNSPSGYGNNNGVINFISVPRCR